MKKNELNENKNTTYQALWDTGKVMLRGPFVALSAYIGEVEKPQVNNLTSHCKNLGEDKVKRKKLVVRSGGYHYLFCRHQRIIKEYY